MFVNSANMRDKPRAKVFDIVNEERVKVDEDYCLEHTDKEADDPIKMTRDCLAHFRDQVTINLKSAGLITNDSLVTVGIGDVRPYDGLRMISLNWIRLFYDQVSILIYNVID